ncbi:MAG: carbamoyltransferase HypF [Acidimicrobiales bacterium]
MIGRERLRVSGTVQGVGFRPFVYRNATELSLGGFVLNDNVGVIIELEGPTEAIAELARRLVDEAPPLARVHAVTREFIRPVGEVNFSIRASEAGAPGSAPVSVDTATCVDCISEIDDPSDRRYNYAFTNCTNCGPRYTIVLGVPYDRPLTTMSAFSMCADCDREYHDPKDRRFHAQPNACPACGPRLQWHDTTCGRRAGGGPALLAAAAALRAGAVIAVKGIGGYHLAADATSEAAVAKLRQRKARDDKPFAVMVADLDRAREVATVDAVAEAALTSARRPIVLIPKLQPSAVTDGVAPGLPEIGLLLPYSPLHHLLLAVVARPLVMTSGNVSDEPIAHEDIDAFERLGALVDGFLSHDRPIHIRCDDSVARSAGGRLQLLRRSRGYAPEPLALSVPAKRQVLALGAELKSTIAVARDGFVVASHHIGDLEHLSTYRSFLQALDHLRHLYGVSPDVVAHDLHPEYLSSKLASELDLPTLAIQHHHAHVAACMVEHGRVEPVLGLAFDGLGYGPDGTMWGGEYLVADLRSFRRVAHLRPVVMPGGVAAIRQPWRMGLAWAVAAGDASGGLPVGFPETQARRAVTTLVERSDGPLTTSVGRLFDAAAALLGIRATCGYEAQAAIELEALARSVRRSDAPGFACSAVVDKSTGIAVLDPSGLLRELIRERDNGRATALLAAGFHEELGRATGSLAVELATSEGLTTVVLTGGVFQNARFAEVVEETVASAGLQVLVHGLIPPNDGGISIGQAAIAAAQ